MIIIDSIKIKADIKSDEEAISFTLKKYDIKNASDIKIVKKSVDARKKDNILYIYSIALKCDKEDILIKKNNNISVAHHFLYNFAISPTPKFSYL